MPTFDYEAYAGDGRRERGRISAATRDDLMSQLKRQGLLLAVATEIGSDTKPGFAKVDTRAFSLFRSAPSMAQFAQLFSELGTLTNANISIAEAIALTVQRQKKSSLTSKLLGEVQAAITNGADLSTALRETRIEVPNIVISLTLAGEARGDLGGALREAGEHLARRAALEDKLRSTLIYPLILAGLAVVAVSIILGFLVPNLLPLFDGTGVQPPTVLLYANALATLLATHGQLIAFGLCVLLLGAIPVVRTDWAARLGARLTLKLPLLGAVFRQRNLALFARTLGTLLRSDVAMPAALLAATQVMPNRLLAGAADKIHQSVTSGAALSEAVAQAGHFSDILTRFISVGEASGRLDEMLIHYADLTDTAVEQSTERLMGLLAPILTIAIGLFIGGLILSVLQAIMSVNELAVG